MGAKQSVPQRVYTAAKNNDVPELQALLQDMRGVDGEARRALLDWRDEEGRTALMWAAQRNHVHALQLLLEEGADVHAMAPKRPQGGSALAEAVWARHEACVELLLRFGADAFSENQAGKTPLDLALEGRATSILRACERNALFAGYVQTKVMQLKGLSTAAKDRWVVISPRFTPPPPGSSVGEVRVMMLLFRNAAEAEPRTKVWLDGAALYVQPGGEAALRLHPNHVQPRNIYCRYESGWMMFFRPAQAPGIMPANGPPPMSPEAAFAAFLATSARPLEQLQQQQQMRLAAAAAANPWAQHAAANILPPQPAAPHAGGPYPPFQQPQQQPYYHPGQQQQLQAAAAPPQASTQQAPPALDDAAMVAQPGESDAEFALRLGSLLGGGGASSSSAPSPAPSAAAPSRLASTAAPPAPPAPPQQQQQQRPPSSSSSAAPAASLPPPSDNPFRAHGAVSSSEPPAASTAAAAAATATAAPAAPAAPRPPAAASSTSFSGPAPSAPPAASVGAPPPDGMDYASDAGQCVVCLSAPSQMVFTACGHLCCCMECYAELPRQPSRCPVCRCESSAIKVFRT